MAPLTRGNVQWAQMDLNPSTSPLSDGREHPDGEDHEDQFSTVGAGQGLFAQGQERPGEIGLEQGVAGCFFEFSLTTLHDLRGAVGTTGTTTSFRNCRSAGPVTGTSEGSATCVAGRGIARGADRGKFRQLGHG